MLTVLQFARRAGRDPETIGRWIRSGRFRARTVGTQHVADELGWAKLYDAYYVALAILLVMPLLTIGGSWRSSARRSSPDED